jgi:imidazolonepropionase-like amidohydrolase
MRIPFLCCLALFVAAPAALAQRAFLPPPDAALVDVRLDPSADAPRHTLILRGGRIAAIQAADAPLPPGLERIEGAGQLCLPAFFDAWARRGVEEPAVVLERDRPLDTQRDVRIDMQLAGRKGLRPAFRAADALVLDDKLLEGYRQAGFAWARLSPGGDLLAGQSALVALREGAPRDLVALEQAGQIGSFEARGDGYPETLMGAFAQLRQFFYDAERQGLIEARRAAGKQDPRGPHDPDLEAGLLLLGGERLWFEADDSRDLERALRLAREFGLELGLLGVGEGFEIAGQLTQVGLPLVLDLDWGKEVPDPREKPKGEAAPDEAAAAAPAVDSAAAPAAAGAAPAAVEAPAPPAAAIAAQAPQSDGPESASDSDATAETPKPFVYRAPLAERLERRLEWERQRDNLRALAETGLPIALGSGLRSPADLLGALRTAVKAGLPRERALAALTGAAFAERWPGAQDGTLAVGDGADLALWSGDPLTDEKAKVRVLLVEGYPWRAAEPADGDKTERAEKPKDASDSAPKGSEQPAAPAGGEVAAAAPAAGSPPAEQVAEPGAAPSGAAPDAAPALAQAPGGDAATAAGAATDEKAADEKAADGPRYLPDHPIETDAERRPRLELPAAFGIRGAWLHTARQPAFRGDLWVEDGRIRALGEKLAFPPELSVLDGAAWHLAPGAIDTHSHMAISRGVNEGTFSITADVDMTDVVDAEDIGLYRALAGGTTLIQILHGSANTIGGRSELLKLRGRAARAEDLRFEAGPQGIKFALGENPKRSNWGAPGQRFPGTRLGVEALLYRAFERAREYQAEWAAHAALVERGEDPLPPRRDVRLEALEGVLSGRLVVHAHSYRADEILMLLRAARHFGFKVGTLHHALEAFKVAREIAANGSGISTFSDWWAYKVEAYEAVPSNAALLIEAGAQASIKSDSDELVRHMYHEAAKSVGYAAMDPVAALRLVTLNPAEQLGVADRVGSLEVGKDADLAVLDGDPLGVRSKVLLTFVEGRLVFERRDAFGLAEAPPPAPPAVAGAALAVEEGAWMAIVGATIHTGAGEVIEDGTLLVSGERIAALGRGLELPRGATRIDAAGMHLYPGLIGLGTSLGLAEIGAVRATDDTIEMGGDQPDLSVASSINADSAHIGVTRFNGMTRAQSIPRSFGAIAGRSAVVRLAGDTWEEMLYRQDDMLHVGFPRQDPEAEGERKERQERQLRGLRTRFEAAQQYGRIVEERRSAGLPPPPFDPRAEALAAYALGQGRVALHADDAHTILAALRFAKDLKLDAVLYGARQAYKVLPALREAGLPVVYGPVLDLPSDGFAPYDAPYATPALLARAGVPFAIFTNQDENPRNLCYHAGFAAAFGLSDEEALRAASLYPARILGLEHELGSLTPGKRADLVLVRGEIFEPTARVERVWIDGRETSLENHQTRLTERFRARLRDPHLGK